MDNQHRKISGYRELSQGEIDLMNRFKLHEAGFNDLIDELCDRCNIDIRQASIAKTDGESAYMRAVRAIAQPERLSLKTLLRDEKEPLNGE